MVGTTKIVTKPMTPMIRTTPVQKAVVTKRLKILLSQMILILEGCGESCFISFARTNLVETVGSSPFHFI